MTKTAIARPRVLMCVVAVGKSRHRRHLNNATAGWVKIQYMQRYRREPPVGRRHQHRYKWARALRKQSPTCESAACVCVLISCARPEKGNWSGVNSRGRPDTALLEIELSAKGKEVIARHCGPQFEMRPERKTSPRCHSWWDSGVPFFASWEMVENTLKLLL